MDRATDGDEDTDMSRHAFHSNTIEWAGKEEESKSDQIRASALDVMADMRSVPNEDTPWHVARTSNSQASGEEASTS
eukprot:CAMPEP_0201962994 /NCGR_PEP_ID=MMETSP0904-20121228/8996_1 /ASSEMBLY_ACC=CAM_ASM_000553 /TAXON_ID=420261 /ORGANISM="Thalassiosira antarctica, Strain CCMP982" /LENGTH=76 /DNA_ID=CAMNT_0048509505 /DNA_START=545 /DNA_END=776 /DNA_ORIENTATION=+